MTKLAWRRRILGGAVANPFWDRPATIPRMHLRPTSGFTQLLTQEIACDTVATIEDALAVIWQAIEKV